MLHQGIPLHAPFVNGHERCTKEERCMQGMRGKLYLCLSVCLFLLGWCSPVNAIEKVHVCHVNGHGIFHLINVASSAVNAHLNHGDAFPGDPVPGNPDLILNESCEASSC